MRREKKFYAVVRGKETGIYDTWETCRRQVEGFPNNHFKGFLTRVEALQYFQEQTSQQEFTPNKRRCTSHVLGDAVVVSSSASDSIHKEESGSSKAGQIEPSSPDIETVAVKTPTQALKEKFDHAHASGQIIELLSPETSTFQNSDSSDSVKVSASAELKEIIQTSSYTVKPSPVCGTTVASSTEDVKIIIKPGILSDRETANLKISEGLLSKSGDRNARITEVLGVNLTLKIREADEIGKASSNVERCMEGDVPQLGLHKKFFVQGVRVGWPYPVIMPPQRQMVNHVILALKRGLHVVLESPTGTGKSAALLCSVLAWQRYHAKCSERPPPKIFYCSRTHSQGKNSDVVLKVSIPH